MTQRKRTNKKKQRPRRTFYEPDQQYIVDWLDSQHNLGTSLQLIITDAIHRYGEGDVIEQYIARRNVAEEFERFPDANPPSRQPENHQVSEPRVTKLKQSNSKSRTQKSKQQVTQTEPDIKRQRGNVVNDDKRESTDTRNRIQREEVQDVQGTEQERPTESQASQPVRQKPQERSTGTAPQQSNTNASSELVHQGERNVGAGVDNRETGRTERKVRSTVAHAEIKKPQQQQEVNQNQKPKEQPKQEPEALEKDYNPIEVMFGDIGSRFE